MSGKSRKMDMDQDLEGSQEFIFYIIMGCTIFFASMVIFWLMNKKSKQEEGRQEPGGPEVRQNRAGGNRRQVAAAARNRRGRRVDDSDSDGEGNGAGGGAQRAQYSDEEMDEKLNDPKLGAKKRAKLEAKAEKRQQREAEERMREERKAKQALEQKEREQQQKQEAEDEKRREEEEKRLREEKAQRELEEYMKMKEMFTVEGEGCEVAEEEEEGNLIEKFIEHIRAKKVILFEELATQFGLKVPDAIDRLTTLVNEGRLTGVMDDRGKFIYISEEELSKFAKFIKQRGRVSIADLVENSASLITLTSEIPEAAVTA
ncbi:DDRGK domain-containing protein 1 [Orchesella cincta]|uniref:DDRGK domain-containing protein 1 n=1 Tax=Orchesella cincta TaxID=48709 RepID=A0A1D2MZZ5_ORCCI|nr:DDRGK domain-containing protein 1 [Orchesella cincta]